MTYCGLATTLADRQCTSDDRLTSTNTTQRVGRGHPEGGVKNTLASEQSDQRAAGALPLSHYRYPTFEGSVDCCDQNRCGRRPFPVGYSSSASGSFSGSIVRPENGSVSWSQTTWGQSLARAAITGIAMMRAVAAA